MIIVEQIVIKKNKNIIYDLHNNIVLNEFVHSNKYKNRTIFTIYK